MTSMSRKSPLAPVPEWRDEVSIIPCSGLQMLDFGFRQSDLEARGMKFIERFASSDPDAVDQSNHWLLPLKGDEELDADILANARPDDDEYSVQPVAAMDPFLNKWVPVPVLRVKSVRGAAGEELYDPGPTAWAMIRTVRLDEVDPETGHTHRIQLALDTHLGAERSSDSYPAPDRTDAAQSRAFRFVSDPDQMGWFVRRIQIDESGERIDPQKWVSDLLEELFLARKRAERPGRQVTKESLPHKMEHWARYLAYLRLLNKAIRFPLLRLANTVGEHDALKPISVDLVLDVGNSRTCGILIERMADEARIDPARSYPLEIRDLSCPEFIRAGLIESRVEFSEFSLLDDATLRRARRAGGFMWPSPVRIGPEALRLVAGDEGTEAVSGLSSPKRYLWDDAEAGQDWRFHNHTDPTMLPRAARSAMRFLNTAGDVISRVRLEEQSRLRPRGRTSTDPAGRPRFSRSSLYGFMLAEIIAHALVQVNSPAGRARRPQSDHPRRLDRIILTLPTATSIQEQAIIRSRARGANDLIWAMSGMSGTETSISRPPEILEDWDEASCTQLVWLYSEITQKFDGHIDLFLKLKGKLRSPSPGAPAEPSLRLACIDIGGGTTDLMIATYFGQENRVLHPDQTFREGFRVAGDDLVQKMISSVVLPELQRAATAAGCQHPHLLRELFGGDIGGQDQQVAQRRRQFALRVLQPLALELLSRCEQAAEDQSFSLAVSDVLHCADLEEGAPAAPGPRLPDALLNYLEGPVIKAGGARFRLTDVVLHCDRTQVDAIARETFQKVLGNLAEVIDHLGVDTVLLTGRPSRLPAVRSIFEEMLVVPPHRLVLMHEYRTGSWYPFRDPVTQRIGDPKSTVAVGGMLIALSEARIPNFKIPSGAFKMRSTAHYIGEMDSSGQIPNNRVLFSDAPSAAGGVEEAEVRMFTPVHLGSRQLPLERWTTTPLYRLDFANAAAQRHPPPLVVRLERTEFDADPDDTRPNTILRREAAREAFTVGEIRDGNGEDVRSNQVILKLQTLGTEDSYWIDTGVFKF